MPRIAGIDIPDQYRLEIALTHVYGIGRHQSGKIITQAQLDPNRRAKDLTSEEIALLQKK